MSQTLVTLELEPSISNATPPFVDRTLVQAAPKPSDELRREVDVPQPANTEPQFLPHGRSIIAIAALTGINFLSSMSSGLLTVGLPRMAADVKLPAHLLLWPSSVYGLTSGSCLLLAGSIADVVGNRLINLTGCFLLGSFIIGCGLARTGIELIMFRALQGVALALCLPTSVAIVAGAVPTGRKRNIGFSCLGLVQPLGFSLGLVLAGVFLDTVGWRLGWYLCGGATLLLILVNVWALPPDRMVHGSKMMRLKTEIDWVGAMFASSCLAMFSYVFATLTSGILNIREPANLLVLCIGVALVPTFIFWERRQERRGKPTLIPNSLWKNAVFTSICLMVMFSYAVANAMELFCSLFFQQVQHLTALETSIRILPSLAVGAVLQLTTGLLVHRIPTFALVLSLSILSAGGPLLMALINPHWPYYYDALYAQMLAPLSADVLFTVGLLVVSDVFPLRTQALAGAVFNTVAEFGTSIGLTVMAIVSSAATQRSRFADKQAPEALLVGYRASFWAGFAWTAVACVIGAFGLRKVGRVGLKKD